MQFLLVTFLALGVQPVPMAGNSVQPQAQYEAEMYDCDCEECCRQRGGHAASHAANRDTRHSMPQTCYSSRYGCYFSSERHMNRYPAFHGTYYRKPYNYRNVFDYPWHAEMHEPTSLFSYNVPDDPNNAEPLPPGAPNARRTPAAPQPRPSAQENRPAPVISTKYSARPVTARFAD